MSCRVHDARYDYKAHILCTCDCKKGGVNKRKAVDALFIVWFIHRIYSWPVNKLLENEIFVRNISLLGSEIGIIYLRAPYERVNSAIYEFQGYMYILLISLIYLRIQSLSSVDMLLAQGANRCSYELVVFFAIISSLSLLSV